ncbi:MAG: GntR family transcriptional regulator [Lactobacillaceae bacterium]|jgi:DNA-binding GntR family transcriptional regulator|nr:GntR family transcriptional regulator [Lactobacillaceae bacterium]
MNESYFNQQTAYDEIQRMIIQLELVPGEKISQKALEEQLSFGRTPIREALIRLQSDGLIEVFPQSGTYVAKIDSQKIENGRFLRETLERRIMVEAAELMHEADYTQLESLIKLQNVYGEIGDYSQLMHYDNEFHRYFYEISNHLLLWPITQLAALPLNRYRYLSLQTTTLDLSGSMNDHKAIVSALRQHDTDQLTALIEQHLHHIDHDKELVIKQFPNYFDN